MSLHLTWGTIKDDVVDLASLILPGFALQDALKHPRMSNAKLWMKCGGCGAAAFIPLQRIYHRHFTEGGPPEITLDCDNCGSQLDSHGLHYDRVSHD